MSAFPTLVARDLRLAVREGGALGTALGFYLIVVALLPLGLGPDLNLLARIAAGVLWIALLLAALLSLPRMFDADYEDGSLDVLAMGPLPLELVAAAKALAHWISTGMPLALLAPVLGILLNLDLAPIRCWSRPCSSGTPAVSFLGAIGGGADAASAPRRAAARAAGAAALRADADLRHFRDRGRAFARRQPAAVPDPFRDLAGGRGAGAPRRRRGAAGADAVIGHGQQAVGQSAVGNAAASRLH